MIEENILFGKKIEIRLANGEKRSARFAIVEMAEILPSHNPRTFSSRKGYPLNANGDNINDRNYTEDLNAQSRVLGYAKELDAIRLVSNSRTASGTPILAWAKYKGKWIVVSGNNRTMSLELAKEDYPENYREYKRTICEEWGAFGFETGACGKDTIVGFDSPILVRIDYDFPAFNTSELAKYNQDTKKGKRPIDKSIELSNILRESKLCETRIPNLFEEFEKMSDFYNNPSAQKQMVDMLLTCNILTENQLPSFYTDGFFTNSGKELIESVLAGIVLDKKALQASERDGIKKLRKVVVYSLPVLMNQKSLGKDSLIKHINEAILYQSKIVASAVPFGEYINQSSMFDVDKFDKKIIYINRLMNMGQRAFKNAINKYNISVTNAKGATMFATEQISSEEIFDKHIIQEIPPKELRLISMFGKTKSITANAKLILAKAKIGIAKSKLQLAY